MEKFGEQISGSKFYRDFCPYCKEPIRVAYDNLGIGIHCSECSPDIKPAFTGLVPRQKHGLSKTTS